MHALDSVHLSGHSAGLRVCESPRAETLGLPQWPQDHLAQQGGKISA